MNTITFLTAVAQEATPTTLYEVISLIITAIVGVIASQPMKKIKENSKRIDESANMLNILRKSTLAATSYRLNETINKINAKLDAGDKDILGHVVSLVQSWAIYHDLGGNGDFLVAYQATMERVRTETPEIYAMVKAIPT